MSDYKIPDDLDSVSLYLTLVEGVLSHRAVSSSPLSMETEAELAEIHNEQWEDLTEENKRIVEDGIEILKERWMCQ